METGVTTRLALTRLTGILGFSPDWTLEKGIKQVVEALRCGNIKDYRDAKYSNVKFLTEENPLPINQITGWEKAMVRNYPKSTK